MSKIRQRTKHLIIAGLVGVLVTGSVSTGIIIYNSVQYQKKENEIRAGYKNQLAELEALRQAEQEKKKEVILLKREIQAGTTITPEDLQQVVMNSDSVPTDSITDPKKIVNKTIKISATKNTPLIPSILYEEDVIPNDLRYQEFNVLKLPSDLVGDQYVDVRINFPTGQDYIVLSKKKVKKLIGATGTVWYEMNEKEILTMSSAIVDAFVNGARLYALTYADPEFQDKAIVTYPVNSKVLELMQNDPNIVEVAKVELNKRLRTQLDKDISGVNEVDKMKYTTGAASYQANNNLNQVQAPIDGNGAIKGEGSGQNAQTKSNSGTNTNVGNGQTTNKNDILKPTTENSIPADKQQDIFKQNQGSVNP